MVATKRIGAFTGEDAAAGADAPGAPAGRAAAVIFAGCGAAEAEDAAAAWAVISRLAAMAPVRLRPEWIFDTMRPLPIPTP